MNNVKTQSNNTLHNNHITNTTIINEILSLINHLEKTNCDINFSYNVLYKVIKFIKEDENIIRNFINDIIIKQAKRCEINFPMIDNYFEEMNDMIQKTNFIVDLNCSMTTTQLQIENKILKENLYNEIDLNDNLFDEMLTLKHELMMGNKLNVNNYDFLLNDEYIWKRDFLLQISVNKELMKKMHISLNNKNLAVKENIDFYFDMYCIKTDTNPYLERFKSGKSKEDIELSLDILQNNIIHNKELQDEYKNMRDVFHNELSEPVRELHKTYDSISLRLDKTLDISNDLIRKEIERRFSTKIDKRCFIKHKKVSKYVKPFKKTYKNYGFMSGVVNGLMSTSNNCLSLKNTEVGEILKNRMKWSKDLEKMSFIKSKEKKMLEVNKLYETLSHEMKKFKREKKMKAKKINQTCKLLKTRKIDNYMEYNNLIECTI